MKFKRIFSVMLVVVLLLSMCPVGTIAAEPVSSGNGWVFTDDGTLTISSNRAMEGNMPGTGDWHDYPTVVTDLVIENGVTHLYDFNQLKITALVIPEGVTYIGQGAFAGNSQLETIVLPKSIKQISSDAFGGCSNIKTVYYAGSESDRNNISFFTNGGPSFGNNDTFNNAEWKYSTASGDGWIFTDDGTLTINGPMDSSLPGGAPWYSDYHRLVTNLVIESGVTHLYALNEFKITTLVIPEGVTYIGQGAFAGNSQLETIVLPKSIKQISSDAFGDCSNIKTVYYAGSECDRNSISFFTNGGPSFGNNDTFNNAEWEYAAASGHDYDADDDGNNEGIVTTAPSCTEQGYTTYTCNVCGDVAIKDYVDALGHTNADAVKENEVAADCTTDGSYDSVIYCSVCDTELSRTTVDIKAFNHNWVNGSCIRCLHNAIKSVLDGNTLTLTLPGFSKSSYIVVSWYDTGDRMLGSYMTGITDETLILNLPIWTTPDKINFSCFDSDSHVLTELNSVNIPALIWIKTTDQEIN